MIAKTEEIKAIFGDLDTSNLEKEFNIYISSLKNLYISIKKFSFSMDQKNKEIIISYYWKNKNAGGRPILDKLAQLPYLPKNIIEQIKQLQVVQSQLKKITDFFDKIDSQINAQNYKGLFTDLKETIENVL